MRAFEIVKEIKTAAKELGTYDWKIVAAAQISGSAYLHWVKNPNILPRKEVAKRVLKVVKAMRSKSATIPLVALIFASCAPKEPVQEYMCNDGRVWIREKDLSDRKFWSKTSRKCKNYLEVEPEKEGRSDKNQGS